MQKRDEKRQFTTKLPPKLIKEFEKACQSLDIYKTEGLEMAIRAWVNFQSTGQK
jgi:hypothetical protein